MMYFNQLTNMCLNKNSNLIRQASYLQTISFNLLTYVFGGKNA